ncbi:MAG: radical SAM protein [Chitinispirillales bacterium]|jgi:MoaA/NifB/PqqE/SkfB family radical SAM enzyme|nr:radical SAM protein [Chitinispirillales bacterium]
MRIIPPSAYLSTITGLCRNFLSGNSIYPFYASFKLTSKCHFGCPFCNVKKDACPDLPTADVKAILRNLSRSPVLMTSFEGGEPLLRKDIEELLIYARQCKFYLLFTTSVKNILSYPIDRYSRYIDFLHVSIDEGHGNLELFDSIPELSSLPLGLSVQTVVTPDTIGALEDKVRICYESGANIVIIPAAVMDNAKNCFPDMDRLERKVRALRKRYPGAIHTPLGFFDAYRKGKCSSASVIIAPDGRLYYPCHILAQKGPDLRVTGLSTWLASKEAARMRGAMKRCDRNCGWYQYYAIDSYTSASSAVDALRPILGRRARFAMTPGRGSSGDPSRP